MEKKIILSILIFLLILCSSTYVQSYKCKTGGACSAFCAAGCCAEEGDSCSYLSCCSGGCGEATKKCITPLGSDCGLSGCCSSLGGFCANSCTNWGPRGYCPGATMPRCCLDKAPTTCFLPGTQISMADDSYKNIEDVKVGDFVKVFNENKQSIEDAPVKEIMIKWHDNVHELHLENGIILKPTANHPFYVKDKGWATISGLDESNIGAKKLEVSDYVYFLNENNELEWVQVTKILRVEGDYLTYNFVDMNYGTFLAEDIVVHNSECFLSGTQITLSDYSTKNIEDIQVGDVVLGINGQNTVTGLYHYILGDQPVYSINGGRFFVTKPHPFMTTDGWKAIDSEAAKKWNPDLEINQLKEGDILITEKENVLIENIQSKSFPSSTSIYNFEVNGDNTYYADGFLVHNKPNSGCAGQPCQATCGSSVTDSNCNCIDPGCTHSPSCSPTKEYDCGQNIGLDPGKRYIRTRSTKCCGGCTSWSAWKLDTDCTSQDAWCQNRVCVDCDSDEDLCLDQAKCKGFEYFSQLYPGNDAGTNLRCCQNLGVTGPGGANEFPKYHDQDQIAQGNEAGIACCTNLNDCSIADKTCVPEYFIDYDNTNAIVDQDFTCIKGNITTRTELIAYKLLELAKRKDPKNFVLHCDKPNLALPTTQWLGKTIQNTNNFCVLQVNKQTYVGVSLNKDSNFLSMLNTSTVCSGITNENDVYQSCDSQKTIFYNPKTESIIFSNKEITNLDANPSIIDAFLTFFRNLITGNSVMITGRPVQQISFGMYGQIKTMASSGFMDQETKDNIEKTMQIRQEFIEEKHPYVSNLNDRFNQFYLSVKDGKIIYAARQTRKENDRNVEIIFVDFIKQSNLCNANYKVLASGNFNCTFIPYQSNPKMGTSSLFMKNSSFTDKFWIDVTASIRPK